MIRLIQLLTLMMYLGTLQGQNNGISPEFKETIDEYLNFSVPTISVSQLYTEMDDVLILDAREEKEYKTSKIPGAVYIGYDHFSRRSLDQLDKDKKVVVYCSIGYRSEKIGEILKKEGFLKVYNLYGSIFAWANAGYQIVDSEGNPTKKIHGYNKSWSQWIVNPDLEKVH